MESGGARMKIGFSSQVCPGWDLDTIVDNASKLGFDGFELRGLRGALNLPLVPELAADPAGVRARLEDNGVELVCMGASATLGTPRARDAAREEANLFEFIELAEKLGCPYVRILVGEAWRKESHQVTLARIAERLRSLAPIATRHRVTLLVENGGDFPGSDDLWFLMDAVGHPAVRCCWNQCTAMTVRERATNSIPRLGHKIALVHLCDALFSEQGMLREYRPLGAGDVGVARQIELLRGLVYDGYLVFDWPALWIDSLPGPDAVLPSVATLLKESVNAKQNVLSAYKGDKNAPRLAPLR